MARGKTIRPRKLARDELEAAYEATHRALAATRFALNDALAGQIEWFEFADKRAGLVRPTSASGGVVIIMAGFPRVEYLDQWAKDVRQAAEVMGGDYHDWMDIVNRMLETRRQAIAQLVDDYASPAPKPDPKSEPRP